VAESLEGRGRMPDYQFDYPMIDFFTLGVTLLAFGVLLFIWWRAER
jgi:hypothetical protein